MLFALFVAAGLVGIGEAWRKHASKSPKQPADALGAALACLASTLREARKWGRRLYAEAGEHEPSSKYDASLDLVRECKEWHASLSKALAEDHDVPKEWRDEWRKDPEGIYLDVTPVAREHFDVIVLWIADRLRLIDWMLGHPAASR